MSLLTARPSSSKIDVKDPFFVEVEERPDWPTYLEITNLSNWRLDLERGDFLVEMALREPEFNFIGIDFSHKGITKLLSQISDLRLKNIRVVYGDANQLLPILFKNEELDSVYINFPDPWPKKRHFHRRLIKPGLVKLIANKVAPKGKVYIATDSHVYALEILDYFNSGSLLQNINPQTGFFESREHLPKTRYERSFLYSGDNVFYLEYSRIAEGGEYEYPVIDASSSMEEEKRE